MKKRKPFKTTIYKIKKNFTQFWWGWLILLIVLISFIVSLINYPELNRISTDFINYFTQIIKPVALILGIILGYPLLKKKLVSSYVSKQFEMIQENNRIVRKECLKFKDKYPIKQISNQLTLDCLNNIIEDIKKINELAIDANPDTYKYSYLVYKSLQKFSEYVENGMTNNENESYYIETIHKFVHAHIDQIYRYSMSIGFVPKNLIKEQPILTEKLNNFVFDNKYIQVEGIESLISYKVASALLVSFFSKNLNTLTSNNLIFHKSCYEIIPTPGPLARILYNHNNYIPLILEGEKMFNFLVTKLVLVGFKRESATLIEEGLTINYVVCYYSNISNFGFVKGCIEDSNSLSEYNDTYINKNTLDIKDIIEFTKYDENIILKLEESSLVKYFNHVEKELCARMQEEMR